LLKNAELLHPQKLKRKKKQFCLLSFMPIR
jgi:hypothetical protein